MKHANGWEEEEDDYSLFASPSKKCPRKHSKDIVDTGENLDTKQQIVPTRKATKIRVRNRKLSKEKAAWQRRLQRQRTSRYAKN